MQSSYPMVTNDMVAQLPSQEPEIPQHHEESCSQSADSQSTAGALYRLSLSHQGYRDWIGDVRNLELPEGVTLDDVLDAAVGLSLAHAIVASRDRYRGYKPSSPSRKPLISGTPLAT